MPIYHARGVSVRLGVLPLYDTITPTIVLKKGDLAKRQCENAEKKLLKSELVPEERVSFPGDERNFELHWLGGAPFMQTQVGKPLFGKERAREPANVRRRYSATNVTDNTGRDLFALSLHVNLSDRTFVSGLDDRNKLHLKVDVLFNGQISGCLFLPHSDVRTGVKSLHQIFTGSRVDYLAERPWVILPSDAAAGGSPSKRKASTAIEKRWNDICEALMRESEERGTDKQGNVPPSAEFLKVLATMQMPAQVSDMQEPGSKEFGVIDVVISAGDGKKVTSGATYLKAPQRLLDTNFPLRNTFQGPEESLTTSGYLATPTDAGQDMPVSAAEMNDMDAEGGDSDSEYEPQPKRRALAPRVMSVCSDSFPFPKHGRTGPEELPDHIGHDTFGSAAFGTPQSLDPFSSSSFNFARTPRMRPSPYSYRFSDPVTGEKTPSALMNLPSFDSIPFLSSPMPQSFQNTRGSLSQSLPRQALQAQPSKCDLGLESTPVPLAINGLPRMSSTVSAHMPPVVPSATRVWPAPPSGLRRQGSLHPQIRVPNMLPPPISPSRYNCTTFGGLPPASPYDRRLSMPLPPTGFFSVPTKPRSSISPSKEGRSESQTSQEGFLLKRLIVKGKGDAVLVDRRWPSAQHITAKSCCMGPGDTAGSSACNSIAGSSGHQEITSVQGPFTVSTPVEHPSRGHKSTLSSSDGKNNQMETLSNSNENSLWFQHPAKSEVLGTVKIGSRTTKDSSAPGKNKETSASDVKPDIPQCRITSNTNILGVQGPKATTFWFEDPEEIMREAARLRRSRSPVKRKHTSGIAKGAILRQVEDVLHTFPIGSSSPLSSVPTTPEPEEKPQTTSNAPPTLEAADSIPQVDGSSDRRVSTVLPRKLATCLKKVARTSPQRRAPDGTLTPTQSLSASAKKRKTAPARYLPKQPRSPDRLKTVSNPSLNQNCVIAFAENEDKDSDQGVLRQVRSERQGVFAEQYVVFATRFFVPGN
jgi:hypothetical protein